MPDSLKADARPLTEQQRDLISQIHNLNPNQKLVYIVNAPGKQIPSNLFGAVYRVYLSGKVNLFQQLHWRDGAR
jgi:hypothetical protein